MRTLKNIMVGTAVATVLAALPINASVAGFDEALTAYESGDYKTAFEEWLPLAEQNNLAAMRNIGLMYRKGLGVEKDPGKAFSWYSRAAELGFDRAQANVASMYMKGEGTEQDYVKAANWFTLAAQQGHVISQYNLGLMYELGRGVERSQAKALAWYNLAAEANHPGALKRMSALVARNPDIKDEAVAAAKAETTPQAATATTDQTKSEPVSVTAPKTVAAPKVVETPKPATKVVAEVPKAPVVTAPAVQKPQVAAPEANTAPKFDPFANSANNAALSGNKAPASKEGTGAPTAFNQPKTKAERVIVEPPKAAAEMVAKTEPVAPVKPQVTEPSVPAVADAVQAEPVSESVRAAAEPEAAQEESQQIAAKRPDSLPKEESPGFFSSLKSLILGDDEEEEDTSVSGSAATAAAVVANAPIPAVPAPTPTSQSVEVVTGSALSVPERLEMAALSYELQEYQQALSVWAPLAKDGNATAQYHLGDMFNSGVAVPVDRIRAYYWWQKASAAGHPEASAALAKLEPSLTFLEKKQLQNIN